MTLSRWTLALTASLLFFSCKTRPDDSDLQEEGVVTGNAKIVICQMDQEVLGNKSIGSYALMRARQLNHQIDLGKGVTYQEKAKYVFKKIAERDPFHYETYVAKIDDFAKNSSFDVTNKAEDKSKDGAWKAPSPDCERHTLLNQGPPDDLIPFIYKINGNFWKRLDADDHATVVAQEMILPTAFASGHTDAAKTLDFLARLLSLNSDKLSTQKQFVEWYTKDLKFSSTVERTFEFAQRENGVVRNWPMPVTINLDGLTVSPDHKFISAPLQNIIYDSKEERAGSEWGWIPGLGKQQGSLTINGRSQYHKFLLLNMTLAEDFVTSGQIKPVEMTMTMNIAPDLDIFAPNFAAIPNLKLDRDHNDVHLHVSGEICSVVYKLGRLDNLICREGLTTIHGQEGSELFYVKQLYFDAKTQYLSSFILAKDMTFFINSKEQKTFKAGARLSLNQFGYVSEMKQAEAE